MYIIYFVYLLNIINMKSSVVLQGIRAVLYEELSYIICDHWQHSLHRLSFLHIEWFLQNSFEMQYAFVAIFNTTEHVILYPSIYAEGY